MKCYTLKIKASDRKMDLTTIFDYVYGTSDLDDSEDGCGSFYNNSDDGHGLFYYDSDDGYTSPYVDDLKDEYHSI